MPHKFPYDWSIANGFPANGIKYHGKKVFSTFACGGGSSFGYKLAGYDVIGANDIDPQMAKVYKENHHPRFFYECPIGDLLKEENLPDEFYDLDILDVSPPCSTFSLAGTREATWKKKKKFREGQSEQVLSDLFFDWIALVKKLQPKVAIAENVKGMLIGNAKLYTKKIIRELNAIGYNVQLFLLNAASMRLPQRRERVFFICSKSTQKIDLRFNEAIIPFQDIHDETDTKCNLTPLYLSYWNNASIGQSVGKFDTHTKEKPNEPLKTIEANGAGGFSYKYPRTLNIKEIKLAGSFPQDYNFLDIDPKYLIGMSVPPVMMAQVAHQVYEQLLK